MHFSFIFATFALALIAHAAPLNVDYSSSLDNSLEPYLTRALEFSARADVNPQILKVGIRFNDAKEEVAPTYRNDALTAQRNSDPLHYRFNVPNRILQRASVLIDSFAQAKGLGPANVFPKNDFPHDNADTDFSFTFTIGECISELSGYCWAKIKKDGSCHINLGGPDGHQIYEYIVPQSEGGPSGSRQ
ncbi:hypothetical protein EV368DRAFT_85983 [Lentinula lateritia]|nr:hypothetical protein EV368DRAFT_85983 [Lentinula lateritia]